MVQVINDPHSGNVFGRLGKGIGQGLSEQVPKEIERSRLASGLKKFEKESQGLSPVQQFTRLAAIPGITPEHLYTLSPLLRQQAQREEGAGIAGGAGQRAESERMATDLLGNRASSQNPAAAYSEQEEFAGKKRPLKSLEATQAQLQPIIQRSDTDLLPIAAQLSNQFPQSFPTPQDALPMVRQQEETRIRNLQEQRSVGETADALQQRIKQRLEGTWGKELTEKGIPTTVQSRLTRNIEDQLADPKNKLSEQQLIDKWSEVGKRIAKQETILKEKAKLGWFSGDRTPTKINDTIENSRQVYADANALEEFQDIIANQFNLTSGTSAYLAYPPKNAEANKVYRSLLEPALKSTFEYSKGRDPTTLSIKAADEILPALGNEDSILAYALQLKNKQLDPQAFLRRAKQNMDAGLFEPNARQREELTKGLPAIPSLGDLYLFTLKNQDKLVSE